MTFLKFSNLQVKGAKFGGKKGEIRQKIFLKVELCGVHGVIFFQVRAHYNAH